MLRLGKVGLGGQAYYLQVAEGTGTGIEPSGRWQGQAAADLGLDGAVAADPLAAVLDGREPGGTRLSPAHDRVRVAAFDLTFCAPKSVSLLHALGDPEVSGAVRAGHDEAVAAVLGYVERRAAAVRGSSDGVRVPLPVRGLVAAGFVHRVSRALDPHLHTHLVVANLACGPVGEWRALDGRGLYAHRAAADALYHAHLRDALSRRLGVAWEPARQGRADIVGIGADVRRAFSQRAAAIAAELAGGGRGAPGDRVPGRRSSELAAARTRPPRDPTVGAAALAGWWRERARAEGLGPAALDRVVDRGPRRARRLPEVAEVVDALGEAPARRHVVAAWCRLAPGGATVADAEVAADRVVSAVARRAGRAVAPWQPGVAEPRLPVGLDRGAERADGDAGRAGRTADRQRADDLLARRLAARGMGGDGGRWPGRGGPAGRDAPGLDGGVDLGLG